MARIVHPPLCYPCKLHISRLRLFPNVSATFVECVFLCAVMGARLRALCCAACVLEFSFKCWRSTGVLKAFPPSEPSRALCSEPAPRPPVAPAVGGPWWGPQLEGGHGEWSPHAAAAPTPTTVDVFALCATGKPILWETPSCGPGLLALVWGVAGLQSCSDAGQRGPALPGRAALSPAGTLDLVGGRG